VNVDDAYLDREGYHALARLDQRTHQPLERQLNFYGGLKWRYEEFVPYERRRIDRMALFQAKQDLVMQEQFLFSDPEYKPIPAHGITMSRPPWRHFAQPRH
jgi:hypothetical protein